MEKMKISEDLCTYIERLHYETNALQDLITRIKNNNDGEELNTFWLDQYFETYKEYVLAKQELSREYVEPVYGEKARWVLDFDTCEVTINQ